MLELICHQRYRAGGVPVDLSPYRNHGRAMATALGVGPAGLDAIALRDPAARVEIARGGAGAWSPLGALRVELVALFDPSTARRRLVSAGSFTLSLHQRLEFTYHSSDADRVVSAPASVVPLGRWTTITAHHDGHAKVRLFVDEYLVAEEAALFGVPGVPDRVTIGNFDRGAAYGRPLGGVLDEIRIWRHDPRAMRREFLGRPMTPDVARCWEVVFRRLRAWIEQQPRQAQQVMGALQDLMDEFLRALLSLSRPQQAALLEQLDRVFTLWFQGDIAGPAMAQALAAWHDAQRHAGLAPDPRRMARLREILGAIDAPPLSVECDPAVVAFLKMLARAQDAAPAKAR